MAKRNQKQQKQQKQQNQKQQNSSKRDSEFSSEFMNGLKTNSNTKQEQK